MQDSDQLQENYIDLDPSCALLSNLETVGTSIDHSRGFHHFSPCDPPNPSKSDQNLLIRSDCWSIRVIWQSELISLVENIKHSRSLAGSGDETELPELQVWLGKSLQSWWLLNVVLCLLSLGCPIFQVHFIIFYHHKWSQGSEWHIQPHIRIQIKTI